jgi:hypothetical protein
VPAVQLYPTNGGTGQQWTWNGSTFSNVIVATNDGGKNDGTVAGPFLADAGNGTATENATGDPWTVLPSGTGYTLRDNRTGLYMSVVSNALAMSAAQTVWTIAPSSQPSSPPPPPSPSPPPPPPTPAPPPATPSPTAITLTPASTTVPDNAAAGTLLATAAVTMSDGSQFTGTLTSSDTTGFFAISGLEIVTGRALTSADDGTHTTTITATQGSQSLSMRFSYAAVLVTCALTPCHSYGGAVSGNLSIDVIPPGTTPPTPPPQAVAAGYTINALNADFSQSFDHECSGHDNRGLWHVNTNGILYNTDCSALTWPYNDQGSQVLRITSKPSNPSRAGISTESQFGAYSVNFPVKGYFECTMRITSHVSPTQEIGWGTQNVLDPGPWSNCWQWQTQQQKNFPGYTGCLVSPSICYERDLFELHGAQPAGFPAPVQYMGGLFTWGGAGQLASINYFTGSTNNQYTSWCSQSPCTGGPIVDPSGYVTYGMLVTAATGDSHCNGRACFKVSSYLNNNLIFDSWYDDSSAGTTDHAAENQRSYSIIDVGYGCWNTGEGQNYCNNIPITGAANSGGNLQLSTNTAECNGTVCVCTGNVGPIYLSGVGGNVPDGTYFYYDVTNQQRGSNNCITLGSSPVAFTLKTYPDGVTVPFTGGYTGGGILNPLTQTDLYVKSWRAWVGCAAWQTTQC